MSEINDGGSAFPCPPMRGCGPDPGMSLREYFAGQALIALGPKYIAEKHEGYCAGYYSRECYEIADAMLRAREVQP